MTSPPRPTFIGEDNEPSTSSLAEVQGIKNVQEAQIGADVTPQGESVSAIAPAEQSVPKKRGRKKKDNVGEAPSANPGRVTRRSTANHVPTTGSSSVPDLGVTIAVSEATDPQASAPSAPAKRRKRRATEPVTANGESQSPPKQSRKRQRISMPNDGSLGERVVLPDNVPQPSDLTEPQGQTNAGALPVVISLEEYSPSAASQHPTSNIKGKGKAELTSEPNTNDPPAQGPISAKRPRGRPRKEQASTASGVGSDVLSNQVEPKHRGRPKEVQEATASGDAESSQVAPKRRGRPKKEVQQVVDIDEVLDERPDPEHELANCNQTWKVVANSHLLPSKGGPSKSSPGTKESALTPRIWASSKTELYTAIPALAPSRGTNAVHWTNCETPVIILDSDVTRPIDIIPAEGMGKHEILFDLYMTRTLVTASASAKRNLAPMVKLLEDDEDGTIATKITVATLPATVAAVLEPPSDANSSPILLDGANPTSNTVILPTTLVEQTSHHESLSEPPQVNPLDRDDPTSHTTSGPFHLVYPSSPQPEQHAPSTPPAPDLAVSDGSLDLSQKPSTDAAIAAARFDHQHGKMHRKLLELVDLVEVAIPSDLAGGEGRRDEIGKTSTRTVHADDRASPAEHETTSAQEESGPNAVGGAGKPMDVDTEAASSISVVASVENLSDPLPPNEPMAVEESPLPFASIESISMIAEPAHNTTVSEPKTEDRDVDMGQLQLETGVGTKAGSRKRRKGPSGKEPERRSGRISARKSFVQVVSVRRGKVKAKREAVDGTGSISTSPNREQSSASGSWKALADSASSAAQRKARPILLRLDTSHSSAAIDVDELSPLTPLPASYDEPVPAPSNDGTATATDEAKPVVVSIRLTRAKAREMNQVPGPTVILTVPKRAKKAKSDRPKKKQKLTQGTEQGKGDEKEVKVEMVEQGMLIGAGPVVENETTAPVLAPESTDVVISVPIPDNSENKENDGSPPEVSVKAGVTEESRPRNELATGSIEPEQAVFSLSTLPKEVRAIIDTFIQDSPVSIIASYDKLLELIPAESRPLIAKEFAFAYLGLYKVVGLEERILTEISGVRPKNPTVEWRFRVRWTPGGEVTPANGQNVPSFPWWIPLAGKSSPMPDESGDALPTPRNEEILDSSSSCLLPEITSKTDELSIPPLYQQAKTQHPNYHLRHLHFDIHYSLIPNTMLVDLNSCVSDEAFPTGWYCSDCGRINFQVSMRHRQCSSASCSKGSKTQENFVRELADLRGPHGGSPVSFPFNDYPKASVKAISTTWKNGMKTLSYYFDGETKKMFAKHVFTSNVDRLQKAATALLIDIQRDVELRRVNGDPYFTCTFQMTNSEAKSEPGLTDQISTGSGAAATVAAVVPECLSRARNLLLTRSTHYAEMAESMAKLTRLDVIGWIAAGSRRNHDPLRAKKSAVAILCLGCDAVMTLVPAEDEAVVKIKKAGSGSTGKAVKPKKAKQRQIVPTMDTSGLISMANRDEGGSEINLEPLGPEQPLPINLEKQPDDNESMPAEMQASVKAETEPDQGGLLAPGVVADDVVVPVRPSPRTIQLTLVHGDVVVLSGSDFKYSLKRTGTSILIFGSSTS